MAKTTQSFIEKAKQVHGDKYDYSLTEYKGWRDNVKIICKDHGVFEQIPNNHDRGAGCPACGLEKQAKSLIAKTKTKKQDLSHIHVPIGSKLIPLSSGRYAIIDEEDYERVSVHNWNVANDYASSGFVGYLHRFIMNVLDDSNFVVDHINHNKMDNRKGNLRICTRQQNNWNKSLLIGGSSQFKGVSWSKEREKWEASIRANDKYITLGRYKDEIEAAQAYDKAAIEYFGEFAFLNFPKNEEKAGIPVDHYYGTTK